MTIPPYLKKGDTIGITCPAGYMQADQAQTCIETLQNWGFEVMVGKTLGSDSKNYFSGTDEERLNELQAMLDDKNIHAVLCGRGGYGMGRIIDKISFTKFKKNPKWIIGFSDITLLHSHLEKNYQIASLHAPMAAAFNDEGYKNEYIGSLHKAILGKKASYSIPSKPIDKLGNTTAKLVGGNLTLLANAIGTPSAIETKGKILFLEDIGEYLYGVDRMLHQLKRAGYFKKLAGLVIGGFTDMKDTTRPFGKSIEEIILEVVADASYPVCFDFPVSHSKENLALKIGAKYQFSITKKYVRLKEV